MIFRVVLLVVVFVMSFCGFAFCEEEMAAVPVAVAPMALPLLIPITVVGILNAGAWLAVGYLVFEYLVQPMLAFVGLVLSIWVLLKALGLFVQLFRGSRES